MLSLSPSILSILFSFSILFSNPVWNNALTLLIGAILGRGKRTICSILRTMGMSQNPSFAKYHHVLNRVNWSPLLASKILLSLILKATGTDKALTFFIDETLERRRGARIKAKGYYRDAVRSSKKALVKSSGLKWLTMAVSWRFPFSQRPFALPFFTVLEPSEKSDKKAGRKHKTTVEWSIQMLKQVVRWAFQLPIILVGDGGFASGELAWTCIRYKISFICRLKINSRLYDFPPPAEPGKRGRKKTKGDKLISFKEMVGMDDLGWKLATIEGYGKKKKTLKYLSNTSLWGADGFFPVPIRWVLVIDPEGELSPLPLMSTDISLSPEKIIALFIQRWNMEVTFFEVREHLGVETQRQWSDKAIARTTPILMGLYTIVCLLANSLREERPIEVEKAAWYEKSEATFSDLLKTVRKALWSDHLIFRKHMIEPFLKNNKAINGENNWISMLIEHLAAA